MPARKPKYTDIREVNAVDETNYLFIDFRILKKEYDVPGLNQVIDELWRIGRALEGAIQNGFRDRLGGIETYYLEAVQWLKGQRTTSSWIVLEPLGRGKELDEAQLANFVQSFMPNFSNEAYNRPLLISHLMPNPTLKNGNATKAMLAKADEKESEVIASIKLAKDNAVKEIRNANGLKEWQGYYDSLVVTNDKKGKPRVTHWKLAEATGNYFDELKHYKRWKNIWLIIFSAAQVCLYILGRVMDLDLIQTAPLHLAAAVFFGSLFVGANKSYRISANLFEQTRFRSVTAKTVQGIMLSDDQFDEDAKRILLGVAAQTLFELKPNGHLTKKESPSPLTDLLTSLLAKR